MTGRDQGAAFVVGLFTGATLGSMAALLLAPTSGKRLRRDAARQGRQLAHRAAETVDEIRDKSTDAYETAHDAVSDAGRAVKDATKAIAG